MVLSAGARRAYLEARHRRVHGTPSPGWRGDPELVEVWMITFDTAAEQSVSPWDALLTVVNRRSQRVRIADQIADLLWRQHRELCADDPERGNPNEPPANVRIWLNESRAEEKLLMRAAKLAVDAGVADALVQRWNREGQLLTDALIAGIDALPLSPDQRIQALEAMHAQLAQGRQPSPSQAKLPPTIEGRVEEDED